MDNKTLTDLLSRRTGLPRKDVSSLLEGFVGAVSDACSEMDSVALPGFGTFEPKKRNERVMAMPSTGKRMLMPPKIVVGFKPSAMLKNRLRGKEEDV